MATQKQPLHLRVADQLNDLAEYIEEALAGGEPPKAVAQRTVLQLKYMASKLRVEGGRR